MSSDKYNGWTNYETWAVALWLDNDQGSQEHWHEQALECGAEEDREEAAHALARILEDYLEEFNPLADSDASIYTDLLTTALNEVNCYEIALTTVDAVRDEIAYKANQSQLKPLLLKTVQLSTN